MQRLILFTAAFAAVMLVDPRPAPAHVAQWCAVVSIGRGGLQHDCRFNSFEECVPNVIAGNRGFCNQNPRWTGAYEPAARPHARHKRHARRH